MFEHVKCDFVINAEYGDYRDWFLEKFHNIHKTKIQVFLEHQLMGETLFPINAKSISCVINTSVKKNISISNYGYFIPEMNIRRKTMFDNITYIGLNDTLNLKIDIDLYGE